MIENALTKKGLNLKAKITVKALVSFATAALAVLLPQAVHAILGASGGVALMPMYLPVLLGACLLGVKWGAVAALAAPALSFFLTGMPTAERLPFMIAELFVFAIIGGAFSKKISEKPAFSVAAVAAAAVLGRGMLLLLSVIFGDNASFTFELVLSQIITGLPGLLLQVVLIPVSVTLIFKGLNHD